MGASPVADNLLFFTELVSMPVLDVQGRRIGRVKDAALVPMVNSSRIDRVLVGGGYTWLTIRYDQIRSIVLGKGIVLNDEVLTPVSTTSTCCASGATCSTSRFIDVTAAKVVRVTDVTLGICNDGVRDTLTVLEVDIGLRSIFPPALPGPAVAPLDSRLQRPIPPIPSCGPLQRGGGRPAARLRLNISYEKLEQMHPADLRYRRRAEPRRTRGHLRNHRQRSGRRRALGSRP